MRFDRRATDRIDDGIDLEAFAKRVERWKRHANLRPEGAEDELPSPEPQRPGVNTRIEPHTFAGYGCMDKGDDGSRGLKRRMHRTLAHDFHNLRASVISVSMLMTREIIQIAKATMVAN
jgi:hypothetical protein